MSFNVLIVDDSAIVRAVVKKTLGMAGVDLGDVFEAGDGEQALQQMDDNWIDIVFADINMPVMTGIEMVHEMVERGTLPTTPVVIISTERSETRMQQLKAEGVSAYLNKPFTPECLTDVIDNVLRDGDDSVE